MIITILGASGFIGINLALALAKAGHSVRCFDRSFNNAVALQLKYNGISLLKGDFFSHEDVSHALTGSEACFHLISTSVPITSNANPTKDAHENIIGTLQMLDIALAVGVRKIIFPSSGGAIYGKTLNDLTDETTPTTPISSYGIAKLTIENYLRLYNNLYGLDYVVLRVANPYGPFQRTDSCQGIISIFLGRILRNEPICIWGDGSIIRDYLYIDDLTKAFFAALEIQPPDKIINIGSGIGTSINELIDIFRDIVDKNFQVEYKPERNLEIPRSILNIQRASIMLHWSPTMSLEQGVKKTWDWLQKNTAFWHRQG